MLGSLVVFLFASLIVGFIMKAGHDREARARKLDSIKQRLAEKDKQWELEKAQERDNVSKDEETKIPQSD